MDKFQTRPKSIRVLVLNVKTIPNSIGYTKRVLLGFGMGRVPKKTRPTAILVWLLVGQRPSSHLVITPHVYIH